MALALAVALFATRGGGDDGVSDGSSGEAAAREKVGQKSEEAKKMD